MLGPDTHLRCSLHLDPDAVVVVALLIETAPAGVGVCLKSPSKRSCRRHLRPCRKHHPRLDLAVAHPWWRHLLERVPMMYPTALTPILVGLVVGIMVTPLRPRRPSLIFPC